MIQGVVDTCLFFKKDDNKKLTRIVETLIYHTLGASSNEFAAEGDIESCNLNVKKIIKSLPMNWGHHYQKN